MLPWVMLFLILGSLCFSCLGHAVSHTWVMLFLILGSCCFSYLGHAVSHTWVMLFLILGSCCFSYLGHAVSHTWVMLFLMLGSCCFSCLGHAVSHTWVMLFLILGSCCFSHTGLTRCFTSTPITLPALVHPGVRTLVASRWTFGAWRTQPTERRSKHGVGCARVVLWCVVSSQHRY